MEDFMVKDPIADAKAEKAAAEKAKRKAERARKQQAEDAAKAEQERLEQERLANIPVPHTAKRLEVRFGGKGKKSKGIKTSDKGCRFESTTQERATVIMAAACTK